MGLAWGLIHTTFFYTWDPPSPHGTLLGQTEYLVQRNDSADCVSPEDRFRYIHDLSLVQLVCLAGLVSEYNFSQRVASDVGIDQVFLPAENYETHLIQFRSGLIRT